MNTLFEQEQHKDNYFAIYLFKLEMMAEYDQSIYHKDLLYGSLLHRYRRVIDESSGLLSTAKIQSLYKR